MPLEKIVLDHGRAWALWRILESEEALAAQNPWDILSPTVTNPQKRREWLAGRVLVKHIMHELGLPFSGITKDEFGKPFLKGYSFHLSLSHSFPYVAALLDKSQSAGIDLEQPKEKLLKIAPRVLHVDEAADAGADIIKHCIYWCAKEALVKVHGKKDLTFAKNLMVSSFSMKDEGDLLGRIIVDDREQVVPLYYMRYPNFVLVFSKRSTS
ncbi:MAG TPA: 4'-phosphopantetheinyl transferase superfamily protein [Ohtaekwangia sp.]|nr:4'-phosphopantetheinyl transferase superfamily protein [Ohtaekwangia sp.]